MNKPNIIWITLDSLKASALPMYGNQICRTPNLERLAAQGIVFENAFAQMPKCIPSRTSMISGRYPHSEGLRVNRGKAGYGARDHNTFLLRTDEYHLPAILKAHGYRTCLKGPNHMLNDSIARKYFDVRQERGTSDKIPGAENLPREQLAMQFPGDVLTGYDMENSNDAESCRKFCAFLQEQHTVPFFGFLDLRITHPWYWKIPGFYEQYRASEMPLPPRAELAAAPYTEQLYRRIYDLENVPQDTWRELVRAYYSMAGYGDMLIGRVLDQLNKSGLEDNTIVIFSADHGDFAGEHGCVEKHDTFFYDSLVHLPLIIRGPGISPGMRFSGLTEFVDIVPTVLELTDLPVPIWVQGASVLSAVNGGAEPRDSVLCEGGLERAALERTALAGGFLLEEFKESFNGQYYLKQKAINDHADFMLRAKMIRTHTHKYIHRQNGHHELYDLKNDAHELRNEFANASYDQIRRDLQEKLLTRMIESETNLPLVEYGWA